MDDNLFFLDDAVKKQKQPLVKLFLHGESMCASFPYNKEIIGIIHDYTINARFSKKERIWKMPVPNFWNLVSRLENYHASDELAAAVQKLRQEEIAVSRLSLDGKRILLEKRHYQTEGAEFLLRKRAALLADEVGLGKSLQALSAAVSIPDVKKILVVCPATLKYNWKAEIEKCTGQPATVINGSKKTRQELYGSNSLFFILNYDLLLTDFSEISSIQWDVIVYDEADALKNQKAQRTKQALKLRPKWSMLLTGTPLHNNYEELHSLIYLLNPYVSGTPYQFRKRYCHIGRFRNITGYKNIDDFMASIDSVYIRRVKSEVMSDMPQKISYTRYLDMDDSQLRVYQKHARAFLHWAADGNNSSNNAEAMVRLLRLRQICDHPILLGEQASSVKMDELSRIMGEIEGKAIVFSTFKRMVNIIASDRRFAEYKPLVISGDVSYEDRFAIVEQFNNTDENKMLVMTEAGNKGLNILAATYILHYDNPWTPSIVEQREGRSAQRFGQTHDVTCISLVCSNSVDIKVERLLEHKRKLSDVIRSVRLEELV